MIITVAAAADQLVCMQHRCHDSTSNSKNFLMYVRRTCIHGHVVVQQCKLNLNDLYLSKRIQLESRSNEAKYLTASGAKRNASL